MLDSCLHSTRQLLKKMISTGLANKSMEDVIPCHQTRQIRRFVTRVSNISTHNTGGTDQPSSFEDPGCCRCRLRNEDSPAKKMVDSYLESATIHGIAQSTGPQHYCCRRLLWLIMILTMTVLLGTTLYKQISRLREYPTRTVIQATMNSELTFPAVTLCNQNPYMMKRIPNIPILKHVLLVETFYSIVSGSLGNNASVLDNMTDVSGEELREIFLHASARLEEFLMICGWDRSIRNCSEIFKPIITVYGTCFMFNGPDTKPEDIAKTTEERSSLVVVANIQSKNNYVSRDFHEGVKVFVHERDEVPFVDYNSWMLRPGAYAAMNIVKAESKFLPKPYKAYRNAYCEDTKTDGGVRGVMASEATLITSETFLSRVRLPPTPRHALA
ncbi:acid-sensing ion channel 1 [Plakobranchus ocellatus]|uniref:Acid-sensing ion channel 1 n=1 Tax=Plakobranchus ocellatus TaxID=259542 RepID=A0AAV3Y6I0_9GAST|nr:acid-sensing ion channel 1 [Plakobranchus ocellatus]